jgi:hypothetical protein
LSVRTLQSTTGQFNNNFSPVQSQAHHRKLNLTDDQAQSFLN